MTTMQEVAARAPSGPKILTIPNEPLSRLLPHGSLIIVASMVGILLTCNVLERWLLRLLYGDLYHDLEKDEKRRRSFTYYHVGATVMSILLLIGCTPVIYFLLGAGEFSTQTGIGRRMTIGDALFILLQMYCGYYLFELCFRTKYASPINIAHHIGLLVIAQTSVALFADVKHHSIASVEFYMCMVWGAFDVVVELPIYISMIVWRVKRENHRLLKYLTAALAVWVVVAALLETAITIFLLKVSWSRWTPTWRVVTPLIFTLWIVTQLYGAVRLVAMSRSEARKCRNKH